MTPLKIPVGRCQKTGKTVQPRDVESGLDAKVTCFGCGEPLLVKKGPVRVVHFSHTPQGGLNCSGESWLHQMVKQIIKESVGHPLVVPGVGRDEPMTLQYTAAQDEYEVAGAGRRIDVRLAIEPLPPEVRQEIVDTGSDRQRVEVIRRIPMTELAVEVKVTNPKDAAYCANMEVVGMPVLEIEAEVLTAGLNMNSEGVLSALQDRLRNSEEGKEWLVAPKIEEAVRPLPLTDKGELTDEDRHILNHLDKYPPKKQREVLVKAYKAQSKSLRCLR